MPKQTPLHVSRNNFVVRQCLKNLRDNFPSIEGNVQVDLFLKHKCLVTLRGSWKSAVTSDRQSWQRKFLKCLLQEISGSTVSLSVAELMKKCFWVWLSEMTLCKSPVIYWNRFLWHILCDIAVVTHMTVEYPKNYITFLNFFFALFQDRTDSYPFTSDSAKWCLKSAHCWTPELGH